MHASLVVTVLSASLAAAGLVVRSEAPAPTAQAVEIRADRHSSSSVKKPQQTTQKHQQTTQKNDVSTTSAHPTHTSTAGAPGVTLGLPNLLPGALNVGWQTPGSLAFIDIALWHHNVHRLNHTAPPAIWNNTLYNWAQSKAETCEYSEDMPAAWGDPGINIAGGTYGIPVIEPNPSAMISGLWYNSEMMNYPHYGVKNPNYKNFNGWGHFSQVVWPGSVEIGCGMSQCGNGWFGLCLYWPPGNWDGEFNLIGRPLGLPMVYPNGQISMK